MSRGVLALALEGAFFAVAFGVRSWVQWRRTGSTGFIRPRRGAPPAELAGACLFTGALVLLVTAPVADLAGLGRIGVLDGAWSATAGSALLVAGAVGTVWSQGVMGNSWRIGVDTAATTALVTTGPFAHVRNPIFAAMVLSTVGLVLLVPNVVAVAALGTLVVALQVQVRRVEEPYLRRTHGPAYERYAASAGRFLPRIGTIPLPDDDLPSRPTPQARSASWARRPGGRPRADTAEAVAWQRPSAVQRRRREGAGGVTTR